MGLKRPVAVESWHRKHIEHEGNDLEDNVNAGAIEAGIKERPPVEELDAQRRPAGGEPGLAWRYLSSLARPTYWRGSSVAVQVVLPRIERTLVTLGWAEPFVASNQYLAYTMVKETPEPIQIGLHWTRLLVRQINAKCQEVGAPLVVLMVPAAIQAEEARYADFLAKVTAKDRYAFDRVVTHDRFVSQLRADGVIVVDPLRALAKDAANGPSAYHREGHWNRRGHAAAAAALAPVLRELLKEP